MAKKDLIPQAEALFVQDLFRVADIATRLGISERTVRTWKEQGDWDRKRAERLAVDQSLAERQRSLAMRILDRVNEMLDEGETPPRHLLAFVVSVAGGMERARSYEQSAPVQEEKQAAGPNPDAIKQAMQLLGLG